jgi:hypothetical protein
MVQLLPGITGLTSIVYPDGGKVNKRKGIFAPRARLEIKKTLKRIIRAIPGTSRAQAQVISDKVILYEYN